ncbi:MAG: hypothetical protein IKW08_04070 [Roseburia sp.]|nr:hypothetical protein [Roseburia sp.]
MKPIIEEKLDAIEIPNNLHERCVTGVMKAKAEMDTSLYEQKLESRRKKEDKKYMKKMVIAAAVMLVCVLAVGNTTMADGIKGMFKDIIRFDGAVTGSEYVNATDEVSITTGEVTVSETEVFVPVEITFLNQETAPFNCIEFVEVDAFEILNADSEVVVSEKDANVVCSVDNGRASLSLKVDTDKLATRETYMLVIECFEGLKKADAPLAVKGEWECTFEIK